MKKYNAIYKGEAFEVKAKNADRAFEKAIKILKDEIEHECYSGDLDIEELKTIE